jgi:hypothetical protein
MQRPETSGILTGGQRRAAPHNARSLVYQGLVRAPVKKAGREMRTGLRETRRG